MGFLAALIYWLIVALWAGIFATVCVAYARNPKTFGTVRLLLTVLLIDTFRNIFENTYFGLYFGALYGFLPHAIVDTLGQPTLLIVPKILNVVAACVVLGLLLLRWLPMAAREREQTVQAMLQAGADLQQEMEEQRRLFEVSVDLLLLIDHDRRLRRVSESARALLGRSPQDMIGQPATVFLDAASVPRAEIMLQTARSGVAVHDFEADCRHSGGHLVPMAFSGVWSPEARRFFVIGRDRSERRAVEARLDHIAHFDVLTGLPNRASLTRDLDDALAEGDGAAAALAVAILDLNRLKDINDTLGHQTGDLLIAAAARRLESMAGPRMRLYRFGGDEFVFLLTEPGAATTITETFAAVLRQMEAAYDLDGHHLFIGASLGLALAPDHGLTAEEVLASADLALYEAKASDVRRVCLFTPELRKRAVVRQDLETQLRRACARGEFELYYQPQVRLSDGAIVGAEALLRWRHPERGLLLPAEFIEALSRSPAALDISTWILKTACATAADWRAKDLPPLRMGVNLFPAQMHCGTLVDDVEQALAASALDPSCLELEITENIALGLDEDLTRALLALRERGVGLALDDFGTGYASLSYLMRYPLTRLKLDRSFVSNLSDSASSEDTAIVRSIVGMAHNLRLSVVAEGVETQEQADFLRRRACEEAQGFLFARPLTRGAFEALLASSGQAERRRLP
ncbi:EAL domain-containing protein [Aquabacter sp. L1I39]|uniref:putative bifunctional diguanylate cyclase/phosphodiesterase n=1 Tax=Aquabacter sp. L1I39 TaxID=2820278 RepID=UPI001ADA0A82|nr:GGDEF domain-containing phosphodiesterase [Aquabacter sp. L1I39]QTL04997.1 EAL domain-containing protein [Aquabacter sp. L1I39]